MPAGSTEHFEGGQVSSAEFLGSSSTSAHLGACWRLAMQLVAPACTCAQPQRLLQQCRRTWACCVQRGGCWSMKGPPSQRSCRTQGR